MIIDIKGNGNTFRGGNSNCLPHFYKEVYSKRKEFVPVSHRSCLLCQKWLKIYLVCPAPLDEYSLNLKIHDTNFPLHIIPILWISCWFNHRCVYTADAETVKYEYHIYSSYSDKNVWANGVTDWGWPQHCVLNTHWNGLSKEFWVNTHNICFHGEIKVSVQKPFYAAFEL